MFDRYNNSSMKANTLHFIITFLVCAHFNFSYDKDATTFIPSTVLAAASTIQVEYTPNITHHIDTWTLFAFGSNQTKHFHERGCVVEASPRNGCSKLKNENDVRGKIVIIDANDCYPQTKMKHAQDAGAKGVMIEQYPFKPSLSYLFDGKDHADLTIPAVQLKSKDKKAIEEYMKQYKNVTIILIGDKDPWDQTYGNEAIWNAFVVIYGLWGLSTITIASKKIFAFWKYQPKNAMISSSVLGLQIMTTLCRLAYGFDIIGTRGWYAEVVGAILASAFFPFFLSAYFLLGLYWRSVSDSCASEGIPEFTNVRIPLMISVPIFFVAEIGSWIPRAMFYSPDLVYTALISLYCIFIFVVSVFYLYHAVRFTAIIFKLKSTLEYVLHLKRLTVGIIAVACFFLLIDVNFVVYLFILGNGPISNTYLFWSSAFLTNLISTSEIFMFPTQTENPSDPTELRTIANKAGEPDSETSGSTNTNTPHEAI